MLLELMSECSKAAGYKFVTQNYFVYILAINNWKLNLKRSNTTYSFDCAGSVYQKLEMLMGKKLKKI